MILQDILSTFSAGILLLESNYSYHNYRIFSYLSTVSFFAYDVLCNNLSKDFLFHHGAASIGIISSYIWVPSDKVFTCLCKIEISTIVLNLIPYVNTKFKQPLQILFFVTFFKYRVYDIYYILHENILYVHFIPILLLYSLNLYWFVIMCKKISSPLKKMNLNILNHSICSYTFFINSIYTIYNYQLPTIVNGMSFLLGCSSYLYHNEIAKYYNGIPTMKSKWILLDVTILHIYKVCCVYLYKNFYKNISCIIHFINLLYIYYYKPYNITDASMPSFFIDFLYFLYSIQSIELYTIGLLIIYIHFINPFYDISYVSTHMVIVWYVILHCNNLQLQL